MKKYSLLALFAAIFSTGFSQEPVIVKDSVLTISVDEQLTLFSNLDTLIDLNKLNGGIVKYQVSDEDRTTIKAAGLEITDPGIITVQDPVMFSTSNTTRFQIKTFAKDDEWYINDVLIRMSGSTPLVYVSADKIEMATGWRKEGKIYVVIAVVVILFAIVLLYLVSLDRRTRALKNKTGA